jgi:hypothetical protein
MQKLWGTTEKGSLLGGSIKAFASTLGLTNFKAVASMVPVIDWKAKEENDERRLRFAARNNWFIQPETYASFMREIEECNEDIEALDELFMEMTSALIPEVTSRLISNYPNRAVILQEAFTLHAEERYYASIPLFLLSAEGIAKDVCNKSVFNHITIGRL